MRREVRDLSTRGRPAAVVAAATLAITLAGCSGGSSSLSSQDFKPGVCRRSAQSVIAVDNAVQQLRNDDKKPKQVVATLKQSQSRLRSTRHQADKTLDARLSALTNAIGAFRIGIDAGTAGPQQTKLVAAALHQVVSSCTTS